MSAPPSTPHSAPAPEAPPAAKKRAPKPPPEEEAGFDPAAFARQRGVWWHAKKNTYFMKGADGGWVPRTRGDFTTMMEAEGLRTGTTLAPTGDVERVMLCVQETRRIAEVMNLAGHVPGVEMIRGARILIEEGPDLIPPVPGAWPLLEGLFRNLFCLPVETEAIPAAWRMLDEKTRDFKREREIWNLLCRPAGPDLTFPGEDPAKFYFDQRPVVFAWLKLSMEVLYRRAALGEKGLRIMRNGQALAIAGPPKGGKSLLFTQVIAKLFGNRMSDAAKYLVGKTTFNGNLFGSELLMLSDTPLSNKMDDRNTLGDGIKRVVAEQWHAWEGKGKDARDQLNPIWRLVIGLNDDANNIRTLPPFTVDGVGDKIHLLHASARKMPMPTTSLDEYLAFSDALAAELPHFVHWLLEEHTIPECLLGSRFGMRTIQAPDLMQEMFEESPTGELLELIDLARWVRSGDQLTLWEMTERENDSGNSALGTVQCLKLKDGSNGPPILWQGSALDLKHVLSADGCSVQREAIQLFKFNKPDRLLSRLAKEDNTRVEPHRTNKQRQWRLAVLPEA